MLSPTEHDLSDDVVEYCLYYDDSLSWSKDDVVRELQSRALQCTTFVEPLVKDHIWQLDQFNLHVDPGNSEEGIPPHLVGWTHFGECIDDEWLIVFLLQELTRHFSGMTASVRDADGQFLLIEAADYLPSWLSPKTSANRVFLRGGHLHLIPYPRSPAEFAFLPVRPTISYALALLARPPGQPGPVTLASTEISSQIASRLRNFPPQLNALHRTTAILPSNLAHFLAAHPTAIAPAVRALHAHNRAAPTHQAHALAVMRRFGLSATSPHSQAPSEPIQRVACSVRMTRCLYAQLTFSTLHPPRGWGPLPPPGDPTRSAAELGMKIAAGFELLLHTTERIASAPPASHKSGPAVGGMFTGALLSKDIVRRDPDADQALAIAALWNAHQGPPPGWVPPTPSPPDPDDWLNLTPEEVDAMCRERTSSASSKPSGPGIAAPMASPSSHGKVPADTEAPPFDAAVIAAAGRRFLASASSYKGVVTPAQRAEMHQQQQRIGIEHPSGQAGPQPASPASGELLRVTASAPVGPLPPPPPAGSPATLIKEDLVAVEAFRQRVQEKGLGPLPVPDVGGASDEESEGDEGAGEDEGKDGNDGASDRRLPSKRAGGPARRLPFTAFRRPAVMAPGPAREDNSESSDDEGRSGAVGHEHASEWGAFDEREAESFLRAMGVDPHALVELASCPPPPRPAAAPGSRASAAAAPALQQRHPLERRSAVGGGGSAGGDDSDDEGASDGAGDEGTDESEEELDLPPDDEAGSTAARQPGLRDFIASMDAELAAEPALRDERLAGQGEDEGAAAEAHLVENWLRSHAAQGTAAGPVSTLLGAMGIALPAPADAEAFLSSGARAAPDQGDSSASGEKVVGRGQSGRSNPAAK